MPWAFSFTLRPAVCANGSVPRRKPTRRAARTLRRPNQWMPHDTQFAPNPCCRSPWPVGPCHARCRAIGHDACPMRRDDDGGNAELFGRGRCRLHALLPDPCTQCGRSGNLRHDGHDGHDCHRLDLGHRRVGAHGGARRQSLAPTACRLCRNGAITFGVKRGNYGTSLTRRTPCAI